MTKLFKIMRIRIPVFLFTLILFAGSFSSAQEKIESQHRIKKSQFPSDALMTIAKNSTEIKRLKFYREVDTAQTTYTAKFKKSRLFYEMDFDQNSGFKSMSFKVKEVDIPDDSFQQMTDYLSQKFEKSKIRKMLQMYPSGEGEITSEETIKKAFQNLMMPNMFYKLLVRGKNNDKSVDYIVIFDSKGSFEEIKKSLPTNYDRILY